MHGNENNYDKQEGAENFEGERKKAKNMKRRVSAETYGGCEGER